MHLPFKDCCYVQILTMCKRVQQEGNKQKIFTCINNSLLLRANFNNVQNSTIQKEWKEIFTRIKQNAQELAKSINPLMNEWMSQSIRLNHNKTENSPEGCGFNPLIVTLAAPSLKKQNKTKNKQKTRLWSISSRNGPYALHSGSYSAILCFRAHPLRSNRMQLWMSDCSFTQHFLNSHQTGCSVVYLLYGWCHEKLLPSRRKSSVHHTTMQQFTVSLYWKLHT